MREGVGCLYHTTYVENMHYRLHDSMGVTLGVTLGV